MITFIAIKKRLHETGIPIVLRKRLRDGACYRELSANGDYLYMLKDSEVVDQLAAQLQVLGPDYGAQFYLVQTTPAQEIKQSGDWRDNPWTPTWAMRFTFTITSANGPLIVCDSVDTPPVPNDVTPE